MANQEKIVVFNIVKGEIGIFTDLTMAAESINMTPSSLKKELDKGVYYTRGFFAGHGTFYKSARGGRRS